jgi:tyrosine-protein phosphatase YwqE
MSLLKSIFGSGKKEPQPELLKDYSSLHTDFHSHLIPGVDDGSQSDEDSLSLMRGLSSLGFKKVITTPHVMSDYFRNGADTILPGRDHLRSLCATHAIPLQVDAAAEYYLDEGFLVKLNNEPLLTLGDKYLLFEISYINPPENILRAVFDMKVKGYKPLLAHPERYPFWYGKFNVYEELKEHDVYFQINTISLAGYYGPGAKKTAEKMIDAGMVNFVGSDMHHTRHLEALRKTLSEKYLSKLVAKGILNNTL